MYKSYNPAILYSWSNSPMPQKACIKFLKVALLLTGKMEQPSTSAVEKANKLWDNNTKNHYLEVKKKLWL